MTRVTTQGFIRISFNLVLKDLKKFGYDSCPPTLSRLSEYPLPNFEEEFNRNASSVQQQQQHIPLLHVREGSDDDRPMDGEAANDNQVRLRSQSQNKPLFGEFRNPRTAMMKPVDKQRFFQSNPRDVESRAIDEEEDDELVNQ